MTHMSDLEMATLFTSLDFDLSGTIEMEEFVKFMNAPIHSLKKKKKIMVTARVAPTPIVPLGEYESEEDAEIMVPPHHPNEGSNSSNSSNSLDTSNNSKPSTRLEHTGTILDIMEEEEPETEEMSSPRNNTIQSKEISSIQENSEEAQDVSSNLTFTKKAVKPSGNQKQNGDQNASTGYVSRLDVAGQPHYLHSTAAKRLKRVSCVVNNMNGNAPKSLQSKTKLGKNQSKPNGDKSTSTPSSPTSFKTQKPANNPKDAPASSPKVRDKVANEGGRDTSANANNANNAIEKSSAMPYEDADAYHADVDAMVSFVEDVHGRLDQLEDEALSVSNIQSRVNNLEESLAHMEAQKLAFADHIDQGIEEWKTSFLVGLTESFDKQLKATHALAEQALALALAKDKKANNPDDAADVDAQKPAGVGNEGSVMGVGNEDNPSEATSLNVASGTRAETEEALTKLKEMTEAFNKAQEELAAERLAKSELEEKMNEAAMASQKTLQTLETHVEQMEAEMLTMSVKYAQTAATLDQTREELRELKAQHEAEKASGDNLKQQVKDLHHVKVGLVTELEAHKKKAALTSMFTGH